VQSLEKPDEEKVSMGAKPVILLDDGGVMNDNSLRGLQYQRLVGEFFAPWLGGELGAWAKANRICTASIFEPEAWRRRAQIAVQDYANFERTYWRDWLSGMCQLVGVEAPPEAECIKLACQGEIYITSRVQSAFPGAIEAIGELHIQGYTLHTASGESSLSLHGYLQAMGVREYFGRLYGSDLLQMLKNTPLYYERLFADAQVAPGEALIVDDSPRVLTWARDLGAMTVLVNAERESVDGMRCIASLAELPELVQHYYA
jgi:HAD superfamily hydrolase (TIGR01509 family)